MTTPHCKHWQLDRDPFVSRFELAAFVATAGQDEARARLEFLVASRKRLGLMLGPSGVGKSFTLAAFAAQERRRGAVAQRISLAGSEPQEWLVRLLEAWQTPFDPTAKLTALWQALYARLAEFRVGRTAVTLLLDDLDEARPESFGCLLRLLLHDESSRWPLTVVLACRSQAVTALPHRLLELVELRIDVLPWELEETAAFLNDAMLQAGRTAPTFTSAAAEAIQALTQGHARHVVQLAELALIAGAGRGLAQIDAELIDSVHAELASI